MGRLILYALVIAGCTVAVFKASDPFNGIAGGIVGGFLLVGLETLYQHLDRWKYLYESLRYFNQPVRLSVSYLFRIKIDDQYLLIRGKRITNRYQPVGGVIKRYPESTEFFVKIGAQDDNMYPIDQSSRNDLRIRIRGIRMFSFMQWFDARKGRETDAWREFYEELVAPGILSRDTFGYIASRYVRRHVSPIKYSSHAQMKERFVAEIYELLPSQQQELELRLLMNEDSNNYLWANEDLIRRRGVVPKQKFKRNISPTAEWTL